MLLSVEDLACARGGVRLLERVCIALEPGSALILRGPNGIGKTTLLRTIAGLQAPIEGRVETDPDQIVFAGHLDAIKSSLTVEENLQFWADVYGGDDVRTAMDAFALASLARRPAGELSAGQRRRLGLSRVLVSKRSIWALDEPTVALDSENVQRFAAVVSTHLASGGCALIATHIDLGLQAKTLELSEFRARLAPDTGSFDEAFR